MAATSSDHRRILNQVESAVSCKNAEELRLFWSCSITAAAIKEVSGLIEQITPESSAQDGDGLEQNKLYILYLPWNEPDKVRLDSTKEARQAVKGLEKI